MNHETELKIQAYVDGELPKTEELQIAELVRNDSEAKALHESLSSTKAVLVGNEPEWKLPEGRDFHWSKIRREIERTSANTETARQPALSRSKWWVRFALPVGFAAFVLAFVLLPQFRNSPGADYHPHEVESPLREMSAITFRSESANMTVVWVESHWD